jgi:hypothetical protein
LTPRPLPGAILNGMAGPGNIARTQITYQPQQLSWPLQAGSSTLLAGRISVATVRSCSTAGSCRRIAVRHGYFDRKRMGSSDLQRRREDDCRCPAGRSIVLANQGMRGCHVSRIEAEHIRIPCSRIRYIAHGCKSWPISVDSAGQLLPCRFILYEHHFSLDILRPLDK